MLIKWQISAGEFFELAYPIAFVAAALASSWVLASSRRIRSSAAASAFWTVGSLLLPLVIFPLFVVRRLFHGFGHGRGNNSRPVESEGVENNIRLPLALPLLYLATILALGAIYFYQDYTSLDAHVARASYARLKGERQRVISEYRAALNIQDDAHIRKLLAIELARDNQSAEALENFQLAESQGESDSTLPFRIAQVLEALDLNERAVVEYRRFLDTSICSEALPDWRCAQTRERLLLLETRP